MRSWILSKGRDRGRIPFTSKEEQQKAANQNLKGQNSKGQNSKPGAIDQQSSGPSGLLRSANDGTRPHPNLEALARFLARRAAERDYQEVLTGLDGAQAKLGQAANDNEEPFQEGDSG